MSMSVRTPSYDFTPYEVNRVGRVAPEQRYYLTRSLRIGVFVGAATGLIPLCALQQYVVNVSSRWQHSTSQIDNLVQYVETFLIAAFVLVALVVGLRDMVTNLRRQRELAIGRLVQSEGLLSWQGQHMRSKYAAEAKSRHLNFPLNSLYALFPGRYRFFYLPNTSMLIAAERIDSVPPHFDLLQRLARTCEFSFGSLAANSARQLSPEQASRLSPRSIGPILFVFFGVLVMAPIFVIALGPQIGGDYVLVIVGGSFLLLLGIAYALQFWTSPRGPVLGPV